MADSNESLHQLVFEQGGEFEETETVWGKPTADADRFILESIPMFAFGVSRGDELLVRSGEQPHPVLRVTARGGHSTYRVAIASSRHSVARSLLRQMGRQGCSFAQLTPTFVAIDLPPSADADGIYSALEEGMTNQVWTFDEVHCGHPSD